MIEPKYDLLLKEDQKYLVLESGKSEELEVLVYENNRRLIDKTITVILTTFENDRSPTVAKWTNGRSKSANGVITCSVQARIWRILQ